MDRKQIQIEKAWEQAIGDIFHPYVDPKREPDDKKMDAFRAQLCSGNYEIRRHIAKTAARQGSTALNRFLADEDWRSK